MGKMARAGAGILTSWSRSRTKMDRLRNTDPNFIFFFLLFLLFLFSEHSYWTWLGCLQLTIWFKY
jgi:hypothetical protein